MIILPNPCRKTPMPKTRLHNKTGQDPLPTANLVRRIRIGRRTRPPSGASIAVDVAAIVGRQRQTALLAIPQQNPAAKPLVLGLSQFNRSCQACG